MCGFHMKDTIKRFHDFDFQGKDYFESAFIATKKNNPLVDKWNFILNKYWDNRQESIGIYENPMFESGPKRDEYHGHDANYFTIMFTLRYLIGKD